METDDDVAALLDDATDVAVDAEVTDASPVAVAAGDDEAACDDVEALD